MSTAKTESKRAIKCLCVWVGGHFRSLFSANVLVSADKVVIAELSDDCVTV